MKKFFSLIVILTLIIVNILQAQEQKLWYKQPASNWNEALPVGNGRLGAMVFGKVYNERIQLNEESLWAGQNFDVNNPNALKDLCDLMI